MSHLQIKWGLLLLLLTVSVWLIFSLGSPSFGERVVPVSGKVLKIEKYFAGNSKAYGIVFDRGGVAQRHFSVDLRGVWDESMKTLTLVEDFIFEDGEVSQRVWVIEKLGESQYRGKADDVIGEAIGFSQGNAFRLNYVLEVPYKGSTIALSIDDWLFLNDDNVLINRAEMYKFGFKVGEVVIAFNKPS